MSFDMEGEKFRMDLEQRKLESGMHSRGVGGGFVIIKSFFVIFFLYALYYSKRFFLGIIHLPRNLREIYEQKSQAGKLRFLVVLILFLLLLSIVIYATFFYHKHCGSEECFFYFLEKCQRAQYSSEGLAYLIDGLVYDTCKVNVYDSAGNKMVCDMAYTAFFYPEERLDNCKGGLKDKLSS